jgi:dTMP kinase
MEHYRGRFVVVDGPDGGGKTTQLDALQSAFEAAGLTVVRAVEPGGTDTGKQIREILLHRKDLALAPMCETLLFMASRAQLMAETVNPALERNAVVLCDRFISATLAYQGALGVDPAMIVALGETAIDGRWPDLTLILDVPVDVGMARVGKVRDRMESRSDDYHSRVRDGFMRLGEVYPTPVVCVDAVGEIADVTARILAAAQAAAQAAVEASC